MKQASQAIAKVFADNFVPKGCRKSLSPNSHASGSLAKVKGPGLLTRRFEALQLESDRADLSVRRGWSGFEKDILAGIVGQAPRMIGFWWVSGHAGVIPGLLTRRFEVLRLRVIELI